MGQVQNYAANSLIPITDVGDAGVTGEAALLCRTDKPGCCSGTREGEWLYPNGTAVRTNAKGPSDPFYRNRGTNVVRLNRRNGATGPTGLYCCEVASVAVPDGAMICINLSKMN